MSRIGWVGKQYSSMDSGLLFCEFCGTILLITVCNQSIPQVLIILLHVLLLSFE